MTTPLKPHPDRLFPADPASRDLARELFASVHDVPIISPHGHVPVGMLAGDEPFPDPAELLITPDHYVLRLLHANGVPLDALGRGPATVQKPDGREIWRRFSEHWDDFLATPVRLWFETELHDVLGLRQAPSAESSDDQYDALTALLEQPSMKPRALFDRFNIDVLATTDDPADDLAGHATLRDDPSFTGRVLPTFRSDAIFDPSRTDWKSAATAIGEAADVDVSTHAGLLDALRTRRHYFIQHGATATDTSVVEPGSTPLTAAERERIHKAAWAGHVTQEDARAYGFDMLYRWAEMSCDDGLVMQLHAGVIRNHHQPTLERFGPDTGHDLPAIGSFTKPLRPLLESFGTNPNLHLVLFTVDETTFSREIGPLAGFYPAVYAGAPWWFLDTPAAIRRYRESITDSTSFRKTSGFIDDTRAFVSIPARHDMARRVDAAYLADLVLTHQITEDDAHRTIRALSHDIPRHTFKLDS